MLEKSRPMKGVNCRAVVLETTALVFRRLLLCLPLFIACKSALVDNLRHDAEKHPLLHMPVAAATSCTAFSPSRIIFVPTLSRNSPRCVQRRPTKFT